MALHRDILWIGRQWAVTGFGMQAINQKHNGQFDIPIERLWDDDLPNGVRGQKWFNPDDFNKGLEIARARHPKPPPGPARAPPPRAETLPQTSPVVATPEPAASPVVAAVEAPSIVTIEVVQEQVRRSGSASFFSMRLLDHPAKLLRVWRARRRS